jgi:hypothetical protein
VSAPFAVEDIEGRKLFIMIALGLHTLGIHRAIIVFYPEPFIFYYFLFIIY